MNERDLFIAARRLEDPAARAAFLAEACGDDTALRQQVEGLLNEQEQLGNFLEAPAIGPADTAAWPQPAEGADTVAWPAAGEGPGELLGPYKLLEVIGEGAFGVVFMAEQQQPVRRMVALKVLKPGMDSRQVVARFEAERQALALMDHPNIAKVLDAGQTSSGRPYFVMDLVKGLHITEFCDQAKLAIRERLELFLTVCQAVQHAHQKGIIHRDVKPSNVLVTLHDGTPLAKVIDFGIAKALGQVLTDKTLYTGFDQLIGTPLYMSPEQAAFSNIDVDTRSDIYSLGVLLYELLTGTTPFDKDRLHQAGYDEMRRIIREEQPARPSTRITAMGQAATAISSKRQSDPKRLGQLFRAELDWVVMKCLEKDRNRRYETVSALARDVQRYLHDEPVRACPPSAGYRLKKFMRKHHNVVLTAVALVGLLVAGTAVSTWQAIRATRAMVVADQEQVRANGRLWESLRSQSRAMRMSRRPGQRLESLQSIAEAMQLPRPPAHTLDELRTEAVAALALPDVELEREWQGGVSSAHRGWAFDGKMQRYARLGNDGTVSVYRIADETLVARWKEFPEDRSPGAERNLYFSPDGRYLSVYHKGSRRLVVRRLDGQEPEVCYSDEEVNADFQLSVDFTSDSTSFAYIKSDTCIIIADLRTGHARELLPSGTEPRAIRFAPDGQRVALAVKRNGEYVVEVRELASGNTEMRLSHPKVVNELCWHPDGRTLATCCEDNLIRLWDAATGKEIRSLQGHRSRGIHCAFNSTGEWLVSNDWQNLVRLWETSSGRQLLSIPSGGYHWLRVSPDGRFAGYKFGDVEKLQLWRVHWSRSYRTIVPAAEPDTGKYPICVHPGGRLLATATASHTVLVDLATGREAASLPGGVYPLLWEPEGGLLTAGPSGLLRWPAHADFERGNYRLGTPERLLNSGPGEYWGASADGQVIAIPQYDAGAVVLHRGPPRWTVRLRPHRGVRGCTVSPDGRWVATVCFGNADDIGIKVWEAATGKLVKEIAPIGGYAAFSPDGRWLLTTAGGCRLWEVGTWTERHRVGGVTGCVSADGRLVAVEDTAGAIRVVSTDSGKLVVRLESPEQTRLIPRCFTPDSTRLVAVGVETQALHVWDLREVRRDLAELGLDWDETAYQPADDSRNAPALRVTVVSRDTALAHVKLGQWDGAASDYALLAESDPGDHWNWLRSGALCLQTGNAEGYRRACREMLSRFGNTDNPEIAERIAKTCSLAPDSVSDFAPVLKLADRAVTGTEKHSGRGWFVLTKGLAEYRAGHYAAALEWLNRFSPRADQVHADATAFAVLAMAKHKLASAPGADAQRLAEEARTALSHAQAILAKKMPNPKAGRPFGEKYPFRVIDFQDWLHAQILVKEAEGLLP
jgi:serine/threonine protein kinase/WD40 repeat protein